jgi:GntR family transcriptional regulator/MocR family aminotransferase
MRSRKALPVSIVLDRDADTSLRDQLVTELTRTIDSLALPVGTRMPSSRTLAEALGVSRGVAVAGYELLLARGYLEVRPGSGTYVARPVPPSAKRTPAPGVPPLVDLRPGRPPAAGFPLAAWRSAWRQAAHRPRTDWLPDLGRPELRRALRHHLETSRWQPLAGYEVAAVADLSAAVRVLLTALAPTGRIGVAEPAPAALHRALSASGWPVTAVPVDDNGPVPAQIPRDVGAVVVPAGAYLPASPSVSVARQRALAAWSMRTGGAVIEVNLHVGTPATASLLALAPPARAYALGSFTALFGAELPVAYLVVPAESAGPVGRLLAAAVVQPPAIAQDALCRLLADGVVDRWATALHRQRLAACATVTRALAQVPGVTVTGPTPDGAAVVWLPPSNDAESVAAAAQARGVLVSTIVDSAPFEGNGLLVDIGHVDEVTARRALRVIGGLCGLCASTGNPAAPTEPACVGTAG